MPFKGFDCGDCRCDFKDCLEKEKHLEGNCKLPYPLLALVGTQSSKAHHKLSVTTCLYCLRKAYIQSTMDYYIDPMSMLQATYGTALHLAVEECEANEWEKEVIVSKEIDGLVIQGTVDALYEDTDGWHLVDYKFSGNQKYNIEYDAGVQKYVLQVRMYSYLYGLDKIKSATILIMPTAQKNAEIMSIEVDLNDKDVQESVDFVIERAKVLDNAYKTNTAPPFDKKDCTRYFCPKSVQELCDKCQ
jgi:hypothetical protein